MGGNTTWCEKCGQLNWLWNKTCCQCGVSMDDATQTKLEDERRGASVDKSELHCPECNSTKVCGCQGGTCYKPIPGIKWICENCLNEW